MKQTICLMDDTSVEVDTNVTSLTLFKLQKEGVIDGTFLKGFMPKKGSTEPDLDPVSILQGVYAAYRQATPKSYVSFEDFAGNYQLDIETDFQIYFAIISKSARKQFQSNFLKVAGSGRGKN